MMLVGRVSFGFVFWVYVFDVKYRAITILRVLGYYDGKCFFGVSLMNANYLKLIYGRFFTGFNMTLHLYCCEDCVLL